MAIEYSTRATAHPQSERESLAGLLGRLIDDGRALLRSEVALAKAELGEAAVNAKLGAAAIGIALVIILAGLMSLVAAIVLGLAEVMEPWLAALLVGISLSAIGVAMLQMAKRKMKAIEKPLLRTQSSLQADAALLTRRT